MLMGMSREHLDDAGWNFAGDAEQKLLKKIQAAGVPLGENVKGQIFYGIKTGLNEAFVIDEETIKRLIKDDPRRKEIIKPFLADRDVKQYQTPKADKYLIFLQKGWTKEN